MSREILIILVCALFVVIGESVLAYIAGLHMGYTAGQADAYREIIEYINEKLGKAARYENEDDARDDVSHATDGGNGAAVIHKD